MNDNPVKQTLLNISSSSVWKLFIIGFIILVLLIPVVWINSLISERYNRRDSVTAEIASKWGSGQVVSGPFISVPYTEIVNEKDNYGNDKPVTRTYYLHIAPEVMDINGIVQSTLQHRGIFKVPGYRAELEFSCFFKQEIESGSYVDKSRLDWDKALITFDLKDERGLKELKANLEGQPVTFNKSGDIVLVEGMVEPPKALSRYSSVAPQDKNTEINFKFAAPLPAKLFLTQSPFKLHLSLTGTQKLSFLSSALRENIQLKGDWPSPSFAGDVLPDSRSVTDKGFTATWHTNYLNTGNKPIWSSEEPNLKLSSLGVNFLVSVDAYQQTTRALKYSILFLLLTFMTFFFMETITRQRIHPIQYLMVGCSLVVFYLLLLSISEHLAFEWSYLIAATGVILQISLYCYSILRTRKFALQVGSMLAGVYAFLYVLLRLEDSALLVGSIGLFILLGIAMYMIRNVNWYNKNEQ